MQSDLELAICDKNWSEAARILEFSDECTIIDVWARKHLADLFRSQVKRNRGKPKKVDLGEQYDMIDVNILHELDELLRRKIKKEAAKVEIAARHGLSVSTVEQLDAKYRNRSPR